MADPGGGMMFPIILVHRMNGIYAKLKIFSQRHLMFLSRLKQAISHISPPWCGWLSVIPIAVSKTLLEVFMIGKLPTDFTQPQTNVQHHGLWRKTSVVVRILWLKIFIESAGGDYPHSKPETQRSSQSLELFAFDLRPGEIIWKMLILPECGNNLQGRSYCDRIGIGLPRKRNDTRHDWYFLEKLVQRCGSEEKIVSV
jgi:hypothetical protein